MKRFLVTLLALGCIAVLIVGNKHWKEKTFVAAEKGKQEIPLEVEEPQVDPESFLKLTANWPAQAKENYQLALEENRPFTILIAGSTDALGSDETAWSTIVKKELEQTYGETVQVIVKSYDLTSKQFKDKDKLEELIAEKPDVTLLEPFTLMDNGNVMISESHQTIEEIMTGLAEEKPEHVLLLQPPNPLYQANYYPVQVDALQKYADEEKIPYLNHWTAWPNPDKKEIQAYLTKDSQSITPSEKGHQAWAEFVLDYFIAD
ncbi:SGNH/GDSL hydrolase family protein [Mesobacillus maritimus]|uniref:SGNH/GDSL hydrolase family protein n=1 Tax=Mesobacillus maritimus TaxID=1643336 RepID=UPI0038501124